MSAPKIARPASGRTMTVNEGVILMVKNKAAFYTLLITIATYVAIAQPAIRRR